MDNTSFDDIRSSIDQLAMTQQLLLACMDTPEQAFPTQPNHAVGVEDDAISMGTVEPLTLTQLDKIKRDVSVFKSTWENLREQYPPGNTDFAPLSFSANSWTAITSTGIIGLDKDLETDETYSQLATMTAYGVELLRKALSGLQVDRRLTMQVYNLLATLCAMLTDSQDRHRSKVTRAVGEKVEAFKRARTMNEDTHAAHTGIHKRARQSEHTPSREQPTFTLEVPCRDSAGYFASPTSSTPGRQVGGSDTGQRGHAYCQDRSSSAGSLQPSLSHIPTTESSSPVTAQNGHLARRAPVPTQFPDVVAPPSTAPSSLHTGIIASAPAASTAELPAIRPSMRKLPTELHRQIVMREALLCQGWTTPAIDAYFNRLTKGTNRHYNSLWSNWVHWCVDRNLDPKKRSSVALDIFYFESAKCKKWKTDTIRIVEVVWSIVDGTVKLSDM